MPASRITGPKATAIGTPYLWSPPPPTTTSQKELDPDPAQLQVHYQRGFLDGQASERETKADAQAEELARTIANLINTRLSVFRSAQGDILRLAVAVARRILHREILMSTDVLGGVISAALKRIEEQDVYRLRVHPTFVARIEEHVDSSGSGKRYQVIGDPCLPLGGCIFETHHGTVDAGIESQLSEIERGLADRLEVRR